MDEQTLDTEERSVSEGETGEASLKGLAVRSAIGGSLMGLANLVPGISGGTMLVASGIYTHFINAISEVTRLRFKKQSLVTLGTVIAAVGFILLTLAKPVKMLVVDYRWVMYSLFIGLTLGGVPVVKGLMKRVTRGTYVSGLVGFLLMTGIAILQFQTADSADQSGFFYMILAGIAGASAMILPGISGGYLFLVMGVYIPILTAVDQFKVGLKSFDTTVLLDVGGSTLLPVGIGVIAGIAVISNLLRFLLRRYESQTLGLLLGLLVGAVVGLYPFQVGVEPKVGDRLKGQTVILAEDLLEAGASDIVVADHKKKYLTGLAYHETKKAVKVEDYQPSIFKPSVLQIVLAIGLIAAGYFATAMIARLSKD